MAYCIIDEVLAADTSGLTTGDICTLLVVSWHADKDTRVAFPGNPLLARETGLTTRGVRKALEHLSADDRWLKVAHEGHRKRVLLVQSPLPMRPSVPSKAALSSAPEQVEEEGKRPSVPTEAALSSGGRPSVPHEAALSSYEAALRATEQVSNRSEEPVTEHVSEPGQHSVLRQGEEEMKPERKPVTSNTGLLEYFMSRMRVTLRDYELPAPGGFNKSAVLGRLSQIRKSSGIDFDELVALVDLYMLTPTLWNRKVHPAADFVTGNTFARLRNRHHEIRVTTSVAEPTQSGTPWNDAILLKYLDVDEGSDEPSGGH